MKSPPSFRVGLRADIQATLLSVAPPDDYFGFRVPAGTDSVD